MLPRYTKYVSLAQASIIGPNLYYLCFVMWLRYQTILLGGYITHKALEDATRIRSAYPHITIYLGVELAVVSAANAAGYNPRTDARAGSSGGRRGD